MKIECKLLREGGTVAEIGGTEYHFAPQADGAHVAEVADDEHVARFLAIPEGYKIYKEAGEAPKTPAKPLGPTETLIGSSVHPGSFEINGKTYTLGDVVCLAHKASELSVEQWNELSEEARHDLIDAQLDKLEADKPLDLEELRAQYKAKFGKAAHPQMKAESIVAKLAE